MASSDNFPTSITHHLKGIAFPATKKDLEKHAKENGADRQVMDTISGMPEEHYKTMADVMKAYGEERRS